MRHNNFRAFGREKCDHSVSSRSIWIQAHTSYSSELNQTTLVLIHCLDCGWCLSHLFLWLGVFKGCYLTGHCAYHSWSFRFIIDPVALGSQSPVICKSFLGNIDHIDTLFIHTWAHDLQRLYWAQVIYPLGSISSSVEWSLWIQWSLSFFFPNKKKRKKD